MLLSYSDKSRYPTQCSIAVCYYFQTISSRGKKQPLFIVEIMISTRTRRVTFPPLALVRKRCFERTH